MAGSSVDDIVINTDTACINCSKKHLCLVGIGVIVNIIW